MMLSRHLAIGLVTVAFTSVPAIAQPLGACCVEEEWEYVCYGDFTESECLGYFAFSQWYEGESCYGSPPFECPVPLGACCVAGDCIGDYSRYDCVNVHGGEWGSGQSCTDPNYHCPGCPAESLFSQPPYDSTVNNRPVGDVPGYENYSVADDVWEVIWWGFHWQDSGGECEAPSLLFTVSFHEDDANAPALDPTHTYAVTAERMSTGIVYEWGGGPVCPWSGTLYEYRATLDQACVLRSGWIMISGGDEPGDCWFEWLGSPVGDGYSYYENEYNELYEQWFDLSLCLLGATQGACCVDEPPYCFVDDAANCTGIFMGNDSECDPNDCNTNGIPDACDIARGLSLDCNDNGIPDECDIADCPGEPWCGDCNGNNIPDECDVASGYSQDCNENGIPDECDIASGYSQDCNLNGIPDECIWLEDDCNDNGVPDWCDIDSGYSQDCNLNGIPDECEASFDYNEDGAVDLEDWEAFADCMSGPNLDYPPDPLLNCPVFDANRDGDVDLADFAAFQLAFTGPDPAAVGLEPPTMSAPAAAPRVQVSETLQTEIEQANSHNVYLFSGEFYVEREDLRIPGRGLDFVWQRKYRSHEGITTPMGVNWDHSYNIYIERSADNLILHDGNARRDRYLPVCGELDRWTADGLFREIVRNPDGTFTVTFVHNTKWHLAALDDPDIPGKITEIEDLYGGDYGNKMTFSYDAQGRLITITDPVDRQVHIEYNADGYISDVIDFATEYAVDDPRGRVIHYEYSPAGDLTAVTYPAVVGTPNGNDFASGKTWTYTYSTDFVDERLNHNLLTITDGRRNDPLDLTYDPISGHYLVNTYAAATDPDDPDFDRIVAQTLGDGATVGGTYHYAYELDDLDPGITMLTTITDRAGNLEDLFYDARHRLVKRIEQTNREVRPTDPDSYTTLYEYNDDSLLTRVEYPNGNVLEQQFDSDNANARARGNRATRRQLPGPLGAGQDEICERWAYGLYYNFITAYANPNDKVTEWQYDGEVPGQLPASCDGLKRSPAAPPDGKSRGTGPSSREVDCEDLNYCKGSSRAVLCILKPEGQRLLDPPSTTPTVSWNSQGQKTESYNSTGGFTEYTYNTAGYVQSVTVHNGRANLITTYEYDSVGNVTAVIDPKGYRTEYRVNALNQVVRRIAPSPFLYESDYYFDANDNFVRVDVQNVDEYLQIVGENPYFTTTYDYDLLDNRIRTTQEVDPSHDVVTEYQYDASENLTLIEYGQVNATVNPQPNNTLRLLYDERDLVFQQVRAQDDPDQSTTQYDYDGNRNLVTRSVGIEGTPRDHAYQYDGYNRMWSSNGQAYLDPMGNVTSYEYDAAGNLITTQINGERIDVVGSAGNELLSEVINSYDAWNRVHARERWFDPGYATLNILSSDASQVILTHDDNEHLYEFAYDDVNRRNVVLDPRGNRHDLTYDDNSNVVTIVEKVASVEHNCCETGHGAGCSDPDIAACVCAEYPDCCNVEWDSVCAEQVEQLGCGLCFEPETFTTTNTYDELNRLATTTDNAGNVQYYLYDSRNNRVLHVNAAGHQTRYVYDGLGRLVQTIRDMDGDGANVGDADDIITSQTWDDSSRLIAQTDDNGNATQYTHDALNRRTAIDYADDTAKTFVYDVHGNVTQSTDANGSVVTNTYDLLDRLTDRIITIDPASGVSSDTTWEQYKYDGLSRIVYAANGNDSGTGSVVERIYDSLNNVVVETLSIAAGPDQTVAATYDGVGNLLASTYPGGRVVTFTYDPLDRIATVSDAVPADIATYRYIGNRVAERDYSNNTRLTYSYDPLQYVRQVAGTLHQFDPDGTPTTLDNRTYTWGAGCCTSSHNKTSRTNALTGVTHNYYYDPANRMVRTIVAGSLIPDPPAYDPANPHGYDRDTLYDLDGVHNRTDVAETGTLPSVPGEYVGPYTMDPTLPDPADYQMNQYTTLPPDEHQYDANGNLTVRTDTGGTPPLAGITYDYANRMVEYMDNASIPAGQRHEYKYDCFGRRIAKIIDADGLNGGPTETRFIYGGQLQWQVYEEQDNATPVPNTLATYVYGNYIDEVLTMQRSGTDYYYHTDDMFNVMAVTDDTATLVERYEYADYGQPQFMDAAWNDIGQSSIANAYLFTGRRYDAETGLYHYRTRDLDPEAGRFTEGDVIGTWGDRLNLGNALTYVGNNAVSWLDPLGLQCDPSSQCCEPEPADDCDPSTQSCEGNPPEPEKKKKKTPKPPKRVIGRWGGTYDVYDLDGDGVYDTYWRIKPDGRPGRPQKLEREA